MTSFFPRGIGPLISVILPSRGRPEGLWNAVHQTRKHMQDKGLAEFIVKADEDDDETVSIVKSWQATLPVKLIVSPRGRGYHDLARYTNECCQVATGDWLLLLNDDAEIITPEWDQVLLKTAYPNGWAGMTEICSLILTEEGVHDSYSFNAMRRQTFDVLGHYSRPGPVDYYVTTTLRGVNATAHIEVVVRHQPNTQERHEAKITDDCYDTWWAMQQPGSVRRRLEDAEALFQRLLVIRDELEWSGSPIDGWNWWRRNEGAGEHGMWVCGKLAVGPSHPGFCVDLQEYTVAELGGQWCKLR